MLRKQLKANSEPTQIHIKPNKTYIFPLNKHSLIPHTRQIQQLPVCTAPATRDNSAM